jgi:hypothetical protein
MRRALALLALAAPLAAKDEYVDEVHPRARSSPLEIVFEPWYCNLCAVEGRVSPQDESKIEMKRMPVRKLAEQLELPRGWLIIVTPHFKILSTLDKTSIGAADNTFARADLERLRRIFPKLKIGRDTRLDPHERAHLYHVRAERIYAHFAALSGNDRPYLGMDLPYELYLFQEYTHHHVFCDRILGRAFDKTGVAGHGGGHPNFMLYTVAADMLSHLEGTGDKVLSNNVVHSVAHNLVDGHGNYYYETRAWLEEGLAHYYTRRENPKYNTFCRAEGADASDFLAEDWEAAVYGMVRRDRDVPFGTWFEKMQPGELSDVEQGMCWSVVSWLVETDPVRFAKMLQVFDRYERLPDGSVRTASSADAIQEAFGVTPNQLHQRWRQYVLEAYRPK